MALATPARTRGVIVLVIVLLVLLALDVRRVLQATRWNAAFAAGNVPADADPSLPEVRFAHARALRVRDDEGALAAFRALQGDTPLGVAAKYNSANLLMRQAIAVRQTNQPGQAIPLIELAKETYRDVLRKQPARWDARYNLERAQRILPDPEPAGDDVPPPPNNSERAVTTMRGVSPGLP